MMKTLIAASLVGLAMTASAPAFAATGNVWQKQLQEIGEAADPFKLPGAQVRHARERDRD